MAANAVVPAAIAAMATATAISFFEMCIAVSFLPSVDGVDADQLDAEIAQAAEEPVQLRLVGERSGEEAPAGVRFELEVRERTNAVLVEMAADDDPVATRLCCALHGPQARRGLGDSSPPRAHVHPGDPRA